MTHNEREMWYNMQRFDYSGLVHTALSMNIMLKNDIIIGFIYNIT